MSITNNWCPTGIGHLRRNFAISSESVTKLPDRNAWRATCPVCERPDVPVVKQGEKFYFSGHTESNLEVEADVEHNRYIKRRERQW